MPILIYLAAFFAGAFLANAVPHFVQGVSGDPFPTPFAKPPGKGLSSPLVNVLWGLLNLVIGCVLVRHAHLTADVIFPWLVFFAGIAILSILLSLNFQHKHRE